MACNAVLVEVMRSGCILDVLKILTNVTNGLNVSCENDIISKWVYSQMYNNSHQK
jgi:uncharacterized protein YegJ (DUF2314 family)